MLTRRARVARPRAARRRRRRLGAALARAVGLQPRAHPVHRRAGDDRRRDTGAAAGDRGRGAVRAAAGSRRGRGRPVATAASRCRRATAAGCAARAAVVAVPINALGAIEFAPALSEDKRARDRARAGLARDQDLHPRARRARVAERDPARSPVRVPRHRGAVRRRDAAADRVRDRRRALRRRPTWRRCSASSTRSCPGYEVLDATAHDWLADELLARDLGDPPPRLVRAPPRRDAARRGARGAGRIGHRQRLVGVHRRRDRVGPAGRPGRRRWPLSA